MTVHTSTLNAPTVCLQHVTPTSTLVTSQSESNINGETTTQPAASSQLHQVTQHNSYVSFHLNTSAVTKSDNHFPAQHNLLHQVTQPLISTGFLAQHVLHQHHHTRQPQVTQPLIRYNFSPHYKLLQHCIRQHHVNCHNHPVPHINICLAPSSYGTSRSSHLTPPYTCKCPLGETCSGMYIHANMMSLSSTITRPTTGVAVNTHMTKFYIF